MSCCRGALFVCLSARLPFACPVALLHLLLVDVSILVIPVFVVVVAAVTLYVLFAAPPLFARVLIIDIILFCFAAKVFIGFSTASTLTH